MSTLHHLVFGTVATFGEGPLDNLIGAFDAAGLAVEAVGGAEHQGVFFKPVDFSGAEVLTGMDAKLFLTFGAFIRFGEGNVGRFVLPVGCP